MGLSISSNTLSNWFIASQGEGEKVGGLGITEALPLITAAGLR
jgi:hypothetical protein